MEHRLIELLTHKYALDPGALDPDVTFDELDLDSLVLVELLVVLERESGVPLPEGLLEPDQTLRAAGAALTAATTGLAA